MRKLIITVVLLSFVGCNQSTESVAETPQGQAEKLQHFHNEFAIDLYQNLSQLDGNIFFSPFSIYTALAMTSEGADGQTLHEMSKVLKLDQLDSLADIRPLVNKQLTEFNNIQNIEMAVANRLWGDKGYQFKESFMTVMRESYQAELGRVDFVTTPDLARRTINSWVDKKTNNRIKDLLIEGAIDRLTRLVLVNAIYFKGDWRAPFNPDHNVRMPFFNDGKNVVNTEMMSQRKKMFYTETKELQVLELPYGESGISMMIYLPKKRNGLAELEGTLNLSQLKSWSTSLRSVKINLLLPKFKLTQSFDLKQSLIDLGMIEAFSPSKANFQKMASRKELFISKVVHKAFLEVNEKGSEAAAATAVVMARKSIARPVEVKNFVVDHPFLFTIEDKKSGVVFFMGRLNKL